MVDMTRRHSEERSDEGSRVPLKEILVNGQLESSPAP